MLHGVSTCIMHGMFIHIPFRMSAANCAHSYQHSLSTKHELPPSWQFGSSLSHKHVYDGFVLLSLLQDHQARQSTLIVPHTGPQKDRFKTAMQERNAHIRLYGQPELRHRCNKCVHVYPAANGEGKLIFTFSYIYTHQCRSCTSINILALHVMVKRVVCRREEMQRTRTKLRPLLPFVSDWQICQITSRLQVVQLRPLEVS
jgi:hypothetical protein